MIYGVYRPLARGGAFAAERDRHVHEIHRRRHALGTVEYLFELPRTVGTVQPLNLQLFRAGGGDGRLDYAHLLEPVAAPLYRFDSVLAVTVEIYLLRDEVHRGVLYAPYSGDQLFQLRRARRAVDIFQLYLPSAAAFVLLADHLHVLERVALCAHLFGGTLVAALESRLLRDEIHRGVLYASDLRNYLLQLGRACGAVQPLKPEYLNHRRADAPLPP